MRYACLAAGAWLLCSLALAGCATATDQIEETEDVYLPTEAGGYERLSQFLPADEATELLESFDWATTTALTETEPDGVPAIYYVVVHVTSLEQTSLLQQARVPMSVEPFFAAERAASPDHAVNMAATRGGDGGWVFALMGGRIYNLARQSALDGAPLLDAIALRAVPGDVPQNADGSLDVRTMFAEGFVWPTSAPSMSAAPAGASVEPLSQFLSDAVQSVVQTGIAIVTFFESLFGAIVASVSVNFPVTVNLTISTPDADFRPVGAPLRRAWGAGATGRGAIITIGGLNTWLERRDLPIPSIYPAPLDFTNAAVFAVPAGRYRFCTQNQIGPVFVPEAPSGPTVIDFWVPTQVCSPEFGINGPTTRAVTFMDQDLQAMAVSVDGIVFMASQQLPVRPPTVASGQQAQVVTSFNGNGFAPGLGGRDLASLTAEDLLDLLSIEFVAPWVGLDLAPIRTLLNVDIVWPPGNPSRLVFSHELGHHMFYQQIVNASLPLTPDLYARHLNTIIAGTFATPALGPGDPFFEPLAINEAFADLFASQFTGGGNRLGPVMGTYPGDLVGTRAGVNEQYCDPMVTGCFEFNVTGVEPTLFPSPPGVNGALNNETSRLSTLFVDLIDDSAVGPGHSGEVFLTTTTGCAPALARCPLAAGFAPFPGPTAGTAEETVTVPFSVVMRGLFLWLSDPVQSAAFTEQALMIGMTLSLDLAGVPRGQTLVPTGTCAVYALHTPGGTCPSLWFP